MFEAPDILNNGKYKMLMPDYHGERPRILVTGHNGAAMEMIVIDDDLTTLITTDLKPTVHRVKAVDRANSFSPKLQTTAWSRMRQILLPLCTEYARPHPEFAVYLGGTGH